MTEPGSPDDRQTSLNKPGDGAAGGLIDRLLPPATDELRRAFGDAREWARSAGAAEIGLDHLFLALIAAQHPDGEPALPTNAALLLDFVDVSVMTLGVRLLADLPVAERPSARSIMPNREVALALALAEQVANTTGEASTETAHVLIALLDDRLPPCGGVERLRASGLVGSATAGQLTHGISALDLEWATLRRVLAESPSLPAAGGLASSGQEPASIEAFTIDLTAQARAGGLDPVIGRDAEIERLVTILSRRTKNNPVLLGEPGVGKTAIVEGLAQRIAAGTVPGRLRDHRILSLNPSRLVAGTRYRGDFEEKTRLFFAGLATTVPPTILFIDEIHMIVGAGVGTDNETLDLGNIMKPALARGELRCIGSTTRDEYRRIIEPDQALERRFQPIEVREPTPEEVRAILDGIVARYALHHGVSYEPAALDACVRYAERHLPARRFPDKAIDLLDESGSAASLAGRTTVSPLDVARVVASMTRVLTEEIGDADQSLRSLGERLGNRVIGQPAAVAAVSQLIRARRVTLSERRGPLASLIFVGPAGSGKAALAAELASVAFGGRLVSIDLADFAEPHSVSGLIGAPRGYIGYEQPAALIEPIRTEPASVVLLRHADLAAPAVRNLVADLIRTGEAADTRGRVASFRDAVVILTVSETAISGPLGFGAAGSAPGSLITQTLGPVLTELVDVVVPFDVLDGPALETIAGRALVGLSEGLVRRRNLHLRINADVLPHLVTRAGRGAGARRVTRLIEQVVEPIVAEAVLMADAQTTTLLVAMESGHLVVRPATVDA